MRVVMEKPIIHKISNAIRDALVAQRIIKTIYLTSAEWDCFINEVNKHDYGVTLHPAIYLQRNNRRGQVTFMGVDIQLENSDELTRS